MYGQIGMLIICVLLQSYFWGHIFLFFTIRKSGEL